MSKKKTLFEIIDSYDSVSNLINELLENPNIWYGLGRDGEEILNKEKFKIIKKNIQCLMHEEKEKACILLGRGEEKTTLESKLKNGELREIFSLGEKAKNYLTDISMERETFLKINDVSKETMEWIFDEYKCITWGECIDKEYFQKESNKAIFSDMIKDNERLRDYYLFGLQTDNSERKTFFVSSSSSSKAALYNKLGKVIILFWLPEPHIEFAVSKSSLEQLKDDIENKRLPLLQDSYFPKEKEFSIKGAIFPDYIYSIIDVDNEKIIVNPKLYNPETYWIQYGFNITKNEFDDSIKGSAYKTHVTRYSDGQYKDGPAGRDL
ncbi:MAG: hypothetical protein NTX03_09455 [Bacteroidetes bacterium]|nr:hypothetical protein [Bacteroidota bacterium]